MMEIFGLGVLMIVAACIWSAWGPRVLLIVLLMMFVVAPALILGTGVAYIEYNRSAQYRAKQDALMASNREAKRERCRDSQARGIVSFDDCYPPAR